MEEIPSEHKPEIQPQEQFLGRVSLIRHGETRYTNQYPDLTETGIADIEQRGEEKRGTIDSDKEEVLIASSPSVRARGSADIIKDKIDPDAEVRIIKAVRGLDIRDHDKHHELMTEMIGEETDPASIIKRVDNQYVHDDRFEERVDVWSPRSEIEKRFFRGVEYTIRAFSKFGEKEPDKLPHLIATSHFEFINHFVSKIFGLKEGEYLNPAENVEVSFLRPQGENERHVPLLVTFRGKSREVVFDRETRTIEIAHQ